MRYFDVEGRIACAEHELYVEFNREVDNEEQDTKGGPDCYFDAQIQPGSIMEQKAPNIGTSVTCDFDVDPDADINDPNSFPRVVTLRVACEL